MSESVRVKYKGLDDILASLIPLNEIEMQHDLVDKKFTLEADDTASSHLSWAQFCLGVSIGAILTFITFNPETTNVYTLAIYSGVIFSLTILGFYFLWMNRKLKARRVIELANIKTKINKRFEDWKSQAKAADKPEIIEAVNEWDKAVQEETLKLRVI